MAGIKGQPTPKPKDVVTQTPKEAVDADLAELNSLANDPDFAELNAVAQTGGAQAQGTSQEAQQVDFPGSGLVRGTLQALPAAGALVGGFVGTGATPGLGTVVGAGVGAVAGQSLRDTLETVIFGEAPQSRQQFYGDLAMKGVEEAAGAATGEILSKAGSAALKTKAGKYVTEKASEIAAAPTQMFRDSFQKLRDKVEEPALQILNRKATSMNTEVAGDTAKKLLVDKIKGKYGPFIQAYEDLDTVSQALPMQDEARRGFTQKLRSWAIDKSGDEYKAVKSFAEALDAADNGAKFASEVKRLNGTIRSLGNAGDTELAATLKAARDQATEFFEGQTTRLASKISAGKATPQELGFMQKIMEQRGITGEDPVKYAKVLSRDYLKSITKVRNEYSAFRRFLEDVGEQTRTRATSKGPMAFLDNIDDVPSEKLIERMFDPKNAAALRRMRDETPEVFDVVVQSKMSEVMKQANKGGRLDLATLHDKLEKLPDSTRAFIMDKSEMAKLKGVVDSPALKTLRAVEDSVVGKMTSAALDAADVSRMLAAQAAKGAVKPQASRQLIGRGVNSALVNTFSQQQQMPSEEGP